MRFYDWQKTFSYQSGTQGEICLVAGAKGIGKTFGLRLQCVNDYLKKGYRFAEICRTNEELKAVSQGYFDKLQDAGFFTDYVFKVEKGTGFIAREAKRPEWKPLMYFAALTNFQREKKRTYANIYRFIFDEMAIDRKDRYHRYLPDEFLILANLLDSMSRQQPNGSGYRVYGLLNAVDLTCPYFSSFGIDKIPDYGYSFYNGKHTLFHYVEPWDAETRKVNTLVGRMLQGNKESEVIFDNKFKDTSNGEIGLKTPNAKYSFGFKYNGMCFAIWIDYKTGIFYVNSRIPRGSNSTYTITKNDSSIDYGMIRKSEPLVQILLNTFYLGGLRYESIALREKFLTILGFFGVK